MRKQALYAGSGFVYALAYGFWTMLVTGGGHGNFVWFKLFCYSSLLGLFFPIMGALTTDLDNKNARNVYLALLLYHILSSTGLLLGWIFGFTDDIIYDGFARTVELVGLGTLIFCGVVHYLPSFIFVIVFFGAAGSRSADSKSELKVH